MMKTEKTRAYKEKGTQDAKTGNYQPPHGLVQELITWSAHSYNEDVAENMAYNEGYYIAMGKLDSLKKTYAPPDKESLKAEYDKGYFGEG